MTRLLVLLCAVLLCTVPVFAQDPSTADTANIALATELLKGLTSLVVLFFVYRSVPASVVRDMLTAAGKAAEKTPTPIDDIAVKVGTAAIDALRPETPAVVTTVTTETKVTETPPPETIG